MISSFSKLTLSYLAYLSSATSLFALQDTVTPVTNVEDGLKVTQSLLEGTIYFPNGDSISGQLIYVRKESARIISPDLIDPVNVPTTQISNITLKSNKSHATEKELLQDKVTLTINGRNNQQGLHGVIKGEFSQIDEKHITLNTNYAGQIKVLKNFVTRMEINSKKDYLYGGPKSLEAWHNNSSEQAWKYTNNSFISDTQPGNIAKDIDIPDNALISFDLSWKSSEYLNLYLYSSDHKQSRPDNYYKLFLQNGRFGLSKYVDGRQQPTVTAKSNQRAMIFQLQHFQQSNGSSVNQKQAHYDIYMSKSKGEIHIFRNGVKIESFTDSKPQIGKFGKALHLVSGTRSPIRIKNILLTKWNGHIPSKDDEKKLAATEGEGQRFLLSNGDILLGKINKVNNGLMQIDTLYTPLNIPISRMRSIDLTASETKVEPIMYKSDIKCWFKDKGWIILKLTSIENGTLSAYHQAFGEKKFDLNVFKQIDFHIYEANAKSSIKADNW